MAVYLDYNASAPIDERVLERMIDVYRSHYGNADSRTHIFGTDAKEIVSSARKTLSEILAVDSTDVFLPAGLPRVTTWLFLAFSTTHLRVGAITLSQHLLSTSLFWRL